jgi:hypothetical protein
MAISKFGAAYAAARKAGKDTFMFKGEKFTTESAEEAKDRKAPGKKSFEDTAEKNIPFGAAYAAARKARKDPSYFMFKGEKFTTESAEEAKDRKARGKKYFVDPYAEYVEQRWPKKDSVKPLKKGGSIDGCARKGKTKGKVR